MVWPALATSGFEVCIPGKSHLFSFGSQARFACLGPPENPCVDYVAHPDGENLVKYYTDAQEMGSFSLIPVGNRDH